jgi:hypothetical protein
MSKKKILIANIGNRNLIYKPETDKVGDDIYISNKSDFRGITEFFVEDYKKGEIKVYDELQLNILSTLLDYTDIKGNDIIDNLEKIILFSSDQSALGESNTKQDTCFAGEIIVELIKRDYDGLSAENRILKGCSVVKVDDLINTYKEELLQISIDYPVSKYEYIICDSGGTPQQKSSLKITVEYLLDRGNYTFYNIYEKFQEQEGLQESEAVLTKDKEYKKLIDNQQIKMLIKTGQYKAAAEICGFLEGDDNDRKKIKTFLEFAGMRLNNVIDPKINSLPTSDFSEVPSLKKYKERKTIGHYSDWSELLKEEHFFQICEVLSIADWYWSLEDYNNATLWYSIFIETYVNCIISNQKNQNGTIKFDLVKNFNSNKIKFENEIRKNEVYNKIKSHINWQQANLRESLPTRCAYSKILAIENSKHQGIMNDIFDCHHELSSNKGLYELRNKYAHNGEGIYKDKVSEYVPSFEKIINTWKKNILGKKNENIYIIINQEIQELLD